MPYFPREYEGESANVSRILDSLLKGYDKRLRPGYKGKYNTKDMERNKILIFCLSCMYFCEKAVVQCTFNKSKILKIQDINATDVVVK